MTDRPNGHERGDPWWASTDPAGYGPESEADEGEPRPDWYELYETLGRAARDATAGGMAGAVGKAARGHLPTAEGVCHICPICTALRLIESQRPEVVMHLTEAVHHLTLAAKTIIDAQAGQFAEADRLRKIDLEDDDA